jgi:phosphopantetheinyl transferase
MSTAAAILICRYPELPALPPSGEPVLVRVATVTPRQSARNELRAALRHILAAWTGLAPRELPLRETPRGPVWLGDLDGHSLDISLSYGEGEGWIGLLRGGWIGVDAMRATPIAEAGQVARDYLGPGASSELRSAADPVHAFALAWTELEARLKCVKRELTEWPGSQIDAAAQCSTVHITLPDAVVVAVATAPAA